MTLHFTEQGSGEPVILLHGLFGMADNLGGIARVLAAQHRVFSVDLRNHGRSPWADSMSLAEMAADVLALLDAQQLPVCDVLGHSLGGKVAMQVALSQPARVRRLVVVDIAPRAYQGNHDAVFAALRSVPLDAISSRREAEQVLAKTLDDAALRGFLLKNLYRRDDQSFAWRMNIDGLDHNYDQLRAAVSAVGPFSGETLFVKGADSNYIREHYWPEILALFPRARLLEIADAGHWVHGDQPAVFNAEVSRFLWSGG